MSNTDKSFTPGPWTIQEVRVVKMSEPVITATRIENGLRKAIKICTMPALSSAVGKVSSSAHEIAANARLIAAAPELLEALKKVPCIGRTDPLLNEWWVAYGKPAISKAEGK